MDRECHHQGGERAEHSPDEADFPVTQFDIHKADPQGKQHHRDECIAEHRNGRRDHHRNRKLRKAHNKAGDRCQNRWGEQYTSPVHLTVDDIDTEGKVQQVRDNQQDDSGRQTGIAKSQQGKRQTQIAAVVKHHWGQKGPDVILQDDSDRPGNQSRAEKHGGRCHRQPRVTGEIEILARHHAEYQRRQKNIHTDGVDRSEVGPIAQAVEIAEAGNRNHRNHDVENSDKHGQQPGCLRQRNVKMQCVLFFLEQSQPCCVQTRFPKLHETRTASLHGGAFAMR